MSKAFALDFSRIPSAQASTERCAYRYKVPSINSCSPPARLATTWNEKEISKEDERKRVRKREEREGEGTGGRGSEREREEAREGRSASSG